MRSSCLLGGSYLDFFYSLFFSDLGFRKTDEALLQESAAGTDEYLKLKPFNVLSLDT